MLFLRCLLVLLYLLHQGSLFADQYGVLLIVGLTLIFGIIFLVTISAFLALMPIYSKEYL